MKTKQKILSQVDLIVPHLRDWAHTFDGAFDDDFEPTDEPFNDIIGLADRLENGTYTEDDLVDIEFHICQINYNELLIDIGYPVGAMPE